MQIDLAKIVASQPATAFDTLADVADWPQIFQSVTSAELVPPGPIRLGSKVREHRTFFGRDGPRELKVAAIDRPRRLCFVVEHPELDYELDHLFDAVYGGGCRIMLIFRSRPGTPAGRALQPLMAPFMGINLRDELERDLFDLAAAVTRTTSTER